MFNVFAVCVNAVDSNARTRSPVARTHSLCLPSPRVQSEIYEMDVSGRPRHVIANASPFGTEFFELGRAATLIHELPFAGSRDSAFVQNRMETKVPSPASFSNGTSDVLNDSSQ